VRLRDVRIDFRRRPNWRLNEPMRAV
jgi:hypothetical protein